MNEMVTGNVKKMLEDNFSGIYIQRSTGEEFNITCPFCQGGKKKEVSFNINIEKMVVRCWRAKCGYRNGLIKFMADHLGKDYQAVKSMVYEGVSNESVVTAKINALLDKKPMTAQQYEIIQDIDVFIEDCVPVQDSPDFEKIQDWLMYRRGYDVLNFLHEHNLYMPPQFGLMKGRCVFEVKTEQNRAYLMYAFEPELMPKTINPPGRVLSQMIYNYDDAKDGEIIMVHEGIFDCARTKSYGFSSCAIFGINMSYQQAFLLRETSATEICLCLDAGTNEQMLKIYEQYGSLWDGKAVSMVVLGDGSSKKDADNVSEDYLMQRLAKRTFLKRQEVSLYDRIKRMQVL